ncbi:head-tail connector protein [Neorhizobium sp. Rsf11]|uniref:Head-tail connector protein n=1 Tax=Neorhizobium phenanthreniclasticum TaxID=3157917 RepID=A0ABV0M2Q4_9HYPH
MAIVDLDDMKEHLRVLYDDDDALITSKIDAAQAHLESLLGYTIETEFTTVPSDVIEAVMLLVGHWYENREASVVAATIVDTPLSVWDIVRERRSYAFE